MTTPAAAAGKTQTALRQLNPTTALAGILVAGLLLRLVFIGADGYRGDINSFMSWAITVAGNPLPDFYSKAGFADYPPGYLLVLWVIGKIYFLYLMLHHGVNDYGFLKLMVKMPAILCDLLDGFLIFAIVRRFASDLWANIAAALFVLNPASIYVSAYWGQVDSVPAAFVLGALALLLYSDRAKWFTTAAWIAIVYAILIKPPAVMIAGADGRVGIRRHERRGAPPPDVRDRDGDRRRARVRLCGRAPVSSAAGRRDRLAARALQLRERRLSL